MSSDGILRLSHAEVRVPDLELALAYYVEVVGLIETARTTDKAYLKGWDEHQHHSLILTDSPTYGLNSLGFKVINLAELDRLAARVEGAGIDVHPPPAGRTRRRLRSRRPFPPPRAAMSST